MKKHIASFIIIIFQILLLSGCTYTKNVSSAFSSASDSAAFEESDTPAVFDSQAIIIELDGTSALSDNESVLIENGAITITDEGSYLLKGDYNGIIKIDTDKSSKVKLLLDNVNLSNSNSACIYAYLADKLTIESLPGTTNNISHTGAFESMDDSNIDAPIFAKCDLTFKGSGILNVSEETKNGIVCKDDLVIKEGTINISALKHAVEGKDSFTMETGILNLADCKEGIQSALITINAGELNICSEDDGLNACSKSDEGVSIIINGGIINIDANGDGIDSNDAIYINGGELYISGPTDQSNGAIDYENTGIITGGTVVAVGSSGMAMNFNDNSTQASLMVNTTTPHPAYDTVTLTDAKGNIIVTYTPNKTFSSVVISSPELKVGETYTLSIADEVQDILIDTLICGDSNMFRPDFNHRPDALKRPMDSMDPPPDFPKE